MGLRTADRRVARLVTAALDRLPDLNPRRRPEPPVPAR